MARRAQSREFKPDLQIPLATDTLWKISTGRVFEATITRRPGGKITEFQLRILRLVLSSEDTYADVTLSTNGLTLPKSLQPVRELELLMDIHEFCLVSDEDEVAHFFEGK